MKLRVVAGRCMVGLCPTVYATDRDTYVVQGFEISDSEALAALRLPSGEAAVEVPRELLLTLAKEVAQP